MSALPPISLATQSAAQSGVAGAKTGLDLIQPVITVFGGGGGDGPDISTSVVQALAAQTKQITSKGTVLGDLGIGPDELVAIMVTIGIAVVTIYLSR